MTNNHLKVANSSLIENKEDETADGCNVKFWFITMTIICAALKVTPNLRGCLPEKNSYARCFLGNHHKLYINKKVIKCRIR